jgi:type I restriction enzyme S subunit
MNAEQLLEHFDRISEAPDAIARLRRFILDLAVRGKLVEQDPNEEPASELLKRIQEGGIKNNKRRSGLSAPIDFAALAKSPRQWLSVSLITLGHWAIGSGFPKNEQGATDGPYFFLKVSDMNLLGNEKYIISANNHINDEAAKRMRVKTHPAGTIIFPKIGGAIATNKRRILTRESAIDNNCLGIVFSEEINLEWAYLLLTTLDFSLYQAGTAVPALQQGVLESISIGLPPLAEQHRIVAKVDELMPLCDQLEATRNEREAQRNRLVRSSLNRISQAPAASEEDEAKAKGITILRDAARFHLDHLPRMVTRPEHVKQLRQTILDLAVRGRLVPQDPNDEPASVSMGKNDARRTIVAQHDRRADTNKQILREPEECWAVPQHWLWRGLSDLALFIDYRGKTPTKVTSGIRLITAKNVKRGYINLFPEEFIAEEAYSSWMSRGIPNEGDVLFTTEAPIGNAAVVHIAGQFALAQRVINFRSYGGVATDFLALQLLSSPFQKILDKTATGLTAKGIKSAKLKRLPIAIPPLAEQHRIVAKVDELMAVCDELSAQLKTTEADSRHFLEAVLRDALEPTGAISLCL